MAVEPHAPPVPESSVAYSPIENELPTYRAISPLAITSLILGLIAVGTFASRIFLIAGVAAIVAGVLAERRIRRSPDALTGRVFAQAGIALGLVFVLSALTFSFVREMKVRRGAANFARTYAEILETGNLADAFWYRSPPNMRTGKTPSKLLDEFRKAAAESGDPMMVEQQIGALERLSAELNHPGASLRFLELEDFGYNEVTPYAFAVYEIQPGEHEGAEAEAEAGHDHEHGPEYALLQIESDPESPAFDWTVEKVVYPYQRGSHDLAPKAIDDGHGH